MKRVACTAVYQHLSRQSVNQRLFIEPSVDIGERLESRTQSIVFNFNYSLFPFWYLLLLTLYLKKNIYNIPHKTQENMQGVVASGWIQKLPLMVSFSKATRTSSTALSGSTTPPSRRPIPDSTRYLARLISFSVYEASASSWLFERSAHRPLQERVLTCLRSFVSEWKIGAAIQC